MRSRFDKSGHIFTIGERTRLACRFPRPRGKPGGRASPSSVFELTNVLACASFGSSRRDLLSEFRRDFPAQKKESSPAAGKFECSAFLVSLRQQTRLALEHKSQSEDRRATLLNTQMKKILCLLLTANLMFTCLAATAQEPANPSSNAKTKALLKYFQSLEARTNKRLFSGQFVNFGNVAKLTLMERVHEKTGHWPALLGVDYADFGKGSLTYEAPNKACIEYWNQGGIVTVSAHLYNPVNPKGGGLRDKGVDLNTLLVTNTETHTRWMGELDLIAKGLQELRDAGVVVLWRPFHEMNGGWFWWGAKDPDSFIKLWRHMFDYFTATKGLDNLLWVYGPNHGNKTAAYYPGDRYVDLVGLDAYTDVIDSDHIKGYAEIAQIKKPFGFTEYGPHGSQNPPGDYDYRRFIEGIQKNFPRATFFMSWNANWSLARNTNTTELLNHLWIVNREDLPKGLAGKP